MQSYVPQMPQYQPASDAMDRASMLSQTVRDGDTFSFPADRDFWNNLVTQVRLYPGAMDPPHFHVDATHTAESLIVNQEFLRRFVAGWERANPHAVKLSGPQGTTTFHASEEFWNRFVDLNEQRARDRAMRGEHVQQDMLVQTGQYPAVQTTTQDWQEICRLWEADKALGAHRGLPPAPAEPQPVHRTRDFDPSPGRNEMLLSQQNQEIDRNRGEIAQKDAELQAGQRRLQDLQAQTQQAAQQARELAERDAQMAAEREAANAEAQRLRSEVDRVRSQMDSMHRGWADERSQLESRLRAVEDQFQSLTKCIERQGEETKRELARKEAEVAAAKQQAQQRALRRELELREQMQEEICRLRSQVSKEVAGSMQEERMSREVMELRAALQDAARCSPCVPPVGASGLDAGAGPAAAARGYSHVAAGPGPSGAVWGDSRLAAPTQQARPVMHSAGMQQYDAARSPCGPLTRTGYSCGPLQQGPSSPWRARQDALSAELRELRSLVQNMCVNPCGSPCTIRVFPPGSAGSRLP
eukprot:TRINITY_DN3615_c0_g1_i5.p1 TRINITY_DN3615_c0_g1~~TRINITY_DN3615_c0_g1_i5.p1  ORF type:complete len:560 (+),score=206.82 TRINITY_DN3615_c0_g1_i5:98-1681(+)